MKKIRTILGDINPNKLGICDAHEHLIRSGGLETLGNKDFLLDSLEAAKIETQNWLDAGGKTIVCMEAIGCGRNVPKMLELANLYENKINFVMTTGFLKGDCYDSRVGFIATVKTDKIVDLIVKEITEGMDLHSYNGPVVERIGAKAGIVKAGASYGLISKIDEKILEIAALTHRATGCPMQIHTQQGTMGIEICEILENYGVDMSKVILCHLQKNPNKYYHREVLDRGVMICYDGIDRAKYYPDNLHAENLKWLVKQGYEDKILLCMDAGRASYQSGYMQEIGNKAMGISYLLKRFVPLLKDIGIDEKTIRKFLTNNPAKVLSFDTDNLHR